jgi:hypothetical protein
MSTVDCAALVEPAETRGEEEEVVVVVVVEARRHPDRASEYYHTAERRTGPATE